MTQVNIHEAKTHLSRLIQRAADGEEIIIAKAGEPLVKMVPYRAEKVVRKPGRLKGKIVIHDDFDELPEDIMAAFRGERD